MTKKKDVTIRLRPGETALIARVDGTFAWENADDGSGYLNAGGMLCAVLTGMMRDPVMSNALYSYCAAQCEERGVRMVAGVH